MASCRLPWTLLGSPHPADTLLLPCTHLAMPASHSDFKINFRTKRKKCITRLHHNKMPLLCNDPWPSVWLSTDVHLCILSELVLQNQSILSAMTDFFSLSFIMEMDIQNYIIHHKIIFCKYNNRTCSKFPDPSQLSQADCLPQWCSEWFFSLHYWVPSQW